MIRDREIARKESQPLTAAANRPTAAPPVDVYENADEILVLADLPGVSSAALKVHLDKGELLIEANRTGPIGGQSLETEYGDCVFIRRFLVPAGIDVARIAAEVKNGVLRLHLPKSAALKPRTIEVRAG
jgi:HSP20 family molecular chaperone IbpA